jgi:hypothetical protein
MSSDEKTCVRGSVVVLIMSSRKVVLDGVNYIRSRESARRFLAPDYVFPWNGAWRALQLSAGGTAPHADPARARPRLCAHPLPVSARATARAHHDGRRSMGTGALVVNRESSTLKPHPKCPTCNSLRSTQLAAAFTFVGYGLRTPSLAVVR